MSRICLLGASAWILGVVAAHASHAAVIDPLDAIANFSAGFGGTTATDNGDSTVTLTRTVADQDAGIDWMIDGTTRLPLDDGHNRLELQPVEPVNGGYYSVSLLFFNAGSDFLGEPYWIVDSQSTSLQVLPDIDAFATGNSISGAATWFIRFRIQPFDLADAAFKFDSIAVIPEPAAMTLLAACGLALRRRSRACHRPHAA